MTPRPKSRFWRRCRIYFRRFRIAVWLMILAVISALLYLNQVGLPGWAKRPLLDKLRARGIELQFTRIRLRWYEGIVAENVRFGRADEPAGPHLTAGEVQVLLEPRALLKFQPQVKALMLRQGRLVWPIAGSEQAPRQLSAEHIRTDLRFLPDDQWALDNFRAEFAGAKIQLSGNISHASAVRDWKFLRADHITPAGVWQNRLRELADTLERIHFSAPPELRLDVRGDARDLQSFTVRMVLAAPGAETPWGAVSEGLFTARLFPAASNELSRAELNLEAAGAETRWGATTNLHLALHLATSTAESNIIRASLELTTKQAETRWASVSNAQLTAQWVHALNNPVPLSGQGELQCERAQIPDWGSARGIRLHAALTRPPDTNAPPPADDSWGEWARFQPYWLEWDGRVQDLQLPKLAAREIACAGSWRAPELTVTNFQVRFTPGKIDACGRWDVASRALTASIASDVEPGQIAPALPEEAQRWLAQFSWNAPPRLRADISLKAPAWTNRQPDWAGEIQPSLGLQGEFNFERGGAYRGVPFATAHSHFSYSNLCWHLPDFTATRPEGRLEAEHRADDRTQDFYWRIRSTLDVRILRPVLEVEQERALDIFTFTQPPMLDLELWGRFHDPERTGLKGRVELTNFTFRGESASSLQTALQYTNQLLEFTAPRIQRGVQIMSADGVAADFVSQKVYLTNGFSTTEPMVIARAIGAHVARAIEPYRFSRPPTARVNGVIPMRGEEDADLHFELEGGPFHWWKFNLPWVAGHVHWRGEHLELQNIRADFYGGAATGSAAFDFLPADGADYQFSLIVSNILLQPLMSDLSQRTNKLEGRLNGMLVITSANYAQENNLNGYGDVELRDGLLWDIPLFGIFSPVLDSILPGMGNSRASAGTCGFTITNATIRTDNLEIHASPMRLRYRGTVDLEGRTNARVEAELLRDMWVVGPVVSTVFWPFSKMFEYKVTGTLDQPKLEPLYFIPKIVLLPFHPFRSLREMLPEEPASSATNSPPTALPGR